MERIDILNRNEFVDDVFTVIETLSANRKSCTFAINGEWGSGKSFVLDMLEEKLSSWQNEETADNQYIVFHYNCWKYDYYEEPLVAIVSALYDDAKRQCDFFKPATTQKFKDAWTRTKSSIGYIAGGVTDRLFGVNIHDMHREVKTDVDATHSEKAFDSFSVFQESLAETKKSLSKITQDYTVVVVVDELDRCLPEYAIKVLERLHHIFDDIENLIVVIAVDKMHLDNTVKSIFNLGENDTSRYLSKFIDFEMHLDKGTVDEHFKDKYKEYYSKFIPNESSSFSETDFVSCLLAGCDARTRDGIFNKALTLHNIVFTEPVEIAVMCVELMWVVFSKTCNTPIVFNQDTIFPQNVPTPIESFAEYFNIEIRDQVYLGRTRNIHSGAMSTYVFQGHPTSTKEHIIYFCLHHPDFQFSVSPLDSRKDSRILEANAESLKDFAKLIELIK